ncbi:bifunctional alpha,alpha-trehalose-phosphate synthase (UDP-forming)/trehalose-phosphatase [Lysinibacter sp. HNR]|nr:bifunctional alpha,alpha-trehalose-phosphate synthase (UDP-forming)/trehalose-phosphatase [Lysinibacter sp. HNR]WGD38594.1 bifunctional alpha,alpha-trehalose-phosphate synthase (UDP-forming)/trehalose-phosphatase [Lysinibacter sp. HNR]
MVATHDFICISNRLPVDRVIDADGKPGWATSPGGLITAMDAVMREKGGAWIGWPGVADEEFEPFSKELIDIYPVMLTAKDVEQFYEGFANDTVWPLYHDVIVPPAYHRDWWVTYQRVNQRFANEAARLASPHAMVWVHDYQLQLVPRMLRELRPDLTIGFFNHIPFPAYELFSQLPWRRQIINGVLGADIIGFQRPADGGNFRRAVRRLLGYKTKNELVWEPQSDGAYRTIVARSFPISIDVAGFEAMAKSPAIQERARELRHQLGQDKVIMLGVDRLDYTKGIRHRIKAYSELLADGRLSVENTTLVQVASPSRERVETYRQLRDEIELTVGRVNGDYGSIADTAVHYLHQGYPREEMVALYLAADVMLVTALRDGMNLVAKEYVATRFDRRGTLVLSEFAGASDELKQALLVNPHDIEGLKDRIVEAATMGAAEQERRMRSLRRRVADHDVARWSQSFLDAMERSRLLREAEERRDASESASTEYAVSGSELIGALGDFSRQESVLVALDFDGTLSPEVDRPEDARALPEVQNSLERLAAMKGVSLALLSGRSLASLRHVSRVPDSVYLVGSHGAEVHDPDTGEGMGISEEEQQLVSRLGAVLNEAVEGIPGVWVESKPVGHAVHTRLASADDALRATAAADSAADSLGVLLKVREGKNIREFAIRDVTKAEGIRLLKKRVGALAVLFAGDDVTDEDAFLALSDGDVSIKVGQGPTAATHRVSSPEAMAEVLHKLAILLESR